MKEGSDEPIVVKKVKDRAEFDEAVYDALIKNLNAYPGNTEMALERAAADVSMTYGDVTIAEVRKYYTEVMLYG